MAEEEHGRDIEEDRQVWLELCYVFNLLYFVKKGN